MSPVRAPYQPSASLAGAAAAAWLGSRSGSSTAILARISSIRPADAACMASYSALASSARSRAVSSSTSIESTAPASVATAGRDGVLGGRLALARATTRAAAGAGLAAGLDDPLVPVVGTAHRVHRLAVLLGELLEGLGLLHAAVDERVDPLVGLLGLRHAKTTSLDLDGSDGAREGPNRSLLRPAGPSRPATLVESALTSALRRPAASPNGRSGPGDLDVLGLALDADELAAFQHRGDAGAPAAGERVEHHAAGRNDQADQPAHQVDRLDGWMHVGPRLAAAAGEDRRLVLGQRSSPASRSARARLGGVEQPGERRRASRGFVRGHPVDQRHDARRDALAARLVAVVVMAERQVSRPIALDVRRARLRNASRVDVQRAGAVPRDVGGDRRRRRIQRLARQHDRLVGGLEA